MPKPRERTKKMAISDDKLEAFASGAEGEQPARQKIARTTISLPADLLAQVEDLARSNKRGGAECRTVSAVVRKALEKLLKYEV